MSHNKAPRITQHTKQLRTVYIAKEHPWHVCFDARYMNYRTVTVNGADVRVYEKSLNSKKTEEYGITIAALARTTSNMSSSTGYIIGRSLALQEFEEYLSALHNDLCMESDEHNYIGILTNSNQLYDMSINFVSAAPPVVQGICSELLWLSVNLFKTQPKLDISEFTGNYGITEVNFIVNITRHGKPKTTIKVVSHHSPDSIPKFFPWELPE